MLDRWRLNRAELYADRRGHWENEARAGERTPAYRPARFNANRFNFNPLIIIHSVIRSCIENCVPSFVSHVANVQNIVKSEGTYRYVSSQNYNLKTACQNKILINILY